jgi:hypothetical protein
MSSANGKPTKTHKPTGQTFEERVERALKRSLIEVTHPGPPPPEGQPDRRPTLSDRLKVLNVAVKWAAVKNKLQLAEHGSGFSALDDLEEEDE